MSFLDNYEPAADRIARFWSDHKNGRIHTEIVMINETEIVVKASIFTDREDTRPVSIDFAHEVRGSSNINKNFFVENCTTSAIARALATFNYQAKKDGKAVRPSREEMKAAQRESVPQAKDLLSRASTAALGRKLEELREIYKEAQAAGMPEEDLNKIKHMADNIK